jgi:hypothetical protein
MTSRLHALGLGAVLLCGACARPAPPYGPDPATPRAAVEALLAADRAFSEASARTDLVSGLSAMFAADVAVPVPGRGMAAGKAQAIEALRGDTLNARSRAEWTPVRGGVSADGTQGFTFGYMTVHRPDGSEAPHRYLAYWVRGPEGWRVAAYRRTPAAAGPASPGPVPPALPTRMVAPSADTAELARVRAGLDAAERAFSARAQQVGLAAAFTEYGSADAVNLGGPREADFVVGAEAIGRYVGAGDPPGRSPVWWEPERVVVASSGDLGVTIGTIHLNEPPADPARPASFPFFTVWRRAGPGAPWRYVAE